MSKTHKTRESIARFFGDTKAGFVVFALGMLLVFGVGGGILVSLLSK